MIYLVIKFLFYKDGTVKKSVYEFDDFAKALNSFHSNCASGIVTENVNKVDVMLVDENLNVHRTEVWKEVATDMEYIETFSE